MPGGDGTGPVGAGPMTGRAAGFCARYGVSGYANRVGGRGRGFWGRGGGGGRGRAFGFGAGRFGWTSGAGEYPAYGPAAPTREQELESLKQQAVHCQGTLEAINRRIGELEAETTSK